jgi:hypothetical protein
VRALELLRYAAVGGELGTGARRRALSLGPVRGS